MKTSIKNTMMAMAAALIVAGCMTTKTTEQLLTESGFSVTQASTPGQIADLKKLPQKQLVPQTRHGQPYWVYADAASNQLYVGTKEQYGTYQEENANAQINAQDRMDSEPGEMATDGAYDGDYNWGAWGVWND